MILENVKSRTTQGLGKQLKQVRHQHIPKPTEKQNEQQMQPTGNESSINVDATQKGKVNEQHQNETT